ncbi:hypothetical protein LZ009_09300 [Ramlibacter sp. XY19]|uniref:hypothetical protein n=1 Tax=Ramlibacter paludis TaxID=2908000 RepID=UPI0023DB55D4|nr:hypothetical protein [Ramlibacter paludis]MCG2592975.1 hypothetical protein [Ramlibacter paludis]
MGQALQKHTFGDAIPAALTRQKGRKPKWLLSDYGSLIWELFDVGDARTITIHWDAPLGEFGRLGEYRHLLESAKRLVYGIRTGPFATARGALTQYTLAQSLFTLIYWMLSRHIEKFEELEMRHVEEFKAGAVRGAHALLNSRGRLQRLIEQKVARAGFSPEDSQEERLAKSLDCFPWRTANSQVRLNRREFVDQLGGSQHITSEIADALSKLEVACGFYSDPKQRARALKDATESIAGLSAPAANDEGSEADAAVTQALAEEDREEDEEEEEEAEKVEAEAGAAAQVGDMPRGKGAPNQNAGKRNGLVNPQRVSNLLLPLLLLYTHRRFLDDHICFHPFRHRDLSAEIKSLGLGRVGRTPTVPVKVAITLIERSARWVMDYARPLLALMKWVEKHEGVDRRDLLKIVRARPPKLEGPASPFPIIHRGRARPEDALADLAEASVAVRSGLSLRTALVFLQTACVVIVAAFTARRASEIRCLKAGCIEKDKSGKYWLRVFIHKTLQDYTYIPVPDLVVKAVRVLERLSKSARAASGTDFLLQVKVPGSGEVRGVNSKGEPITSIRNDLRNFGFFVDVPPLEDGTRWCFAPHQFRRFFAVMYVWAYDYGDIDALSFHLRHWNRKQTRRYCTEKRVGRPVTVANRERAALILSRAALGELKFAGRPRLLKAAERLCARMARFTHVMTAEKAAPRIGRLLERSGANIEAFLWGYCFSTASGEESGSDCNKDSGTPRTERASPGTCSGCSKILRFTPHQRYLRGCFDSHKKVAESERAPALMRQASRRIVAKLELVEDIS